MRAAWPPSPEEDELLQRLATLLARGGAAHFLDGEVARADERDFPDRWEPTAAALRRLLLRLVWLTSLDLDVAIDDRQGEAGAARRALQGPPIRGIHRSLIRWSGSADGVARFELREIGDDNVAALASRELGRAFASEVASAVPYRDGGAAPSDRDGAIAAIYLGLGAIVLGDLASLAYLVREVDGRRADAPMDAEDAPISTERLSTSGAIYLVAVQAVLRATPIEAHATLPHDPRRRVRETIAALAPHRDALAARLGIDLAAPRPALGRPPAPRGVTERTFRVRGSRRFRTARAFGVGLPIALVGALVPHLTETIRMAFATVAGWAGLIAGSPGAVVDRCARCDAVLPTRATSCPACGASIAGRIARARDRLAAEQALDEGRGLDDFA